jgi:hypothetical protein
MDRTVRHGKFILEFLVIQGSVKFLRRFLWIGFNNRVGRTSLLSRCRVFGNRGRLLFNDWLLGLLNSNFYLFGYRWSNRGHNGYKRH